ncbi:zinc-ribbon and DUF3426 domain-containing protein [Thiobacillus sedimenti]|uniref:Zinc-ribbon and DUF3426 domain-containing protein n=1 Tax=Thiobacillus sedimenti TaxID=3110231 RepID=A0ABZ1CKU9_9PROT|nr:zinc-ribbon and DUF3426 domain-containing protein [Thiobacillus sp. SCUT-2]WRS39491.1 zinc-ribbon and DUF3426 domain-containing protein [Thiobacillus sp. SCUT-2]
MKYRTTCPHCASIFRLGPDQLDAAQGWVQCSVCGAAFDARPSLLMEDGSPLPLPAPVEPPPEPAVQPVEVAPAVADTFLPEVPPPAAAPPDEAPLAAERPHGIAQREVASDLPSIILIDPEIPVPEDLGPVPQIYPAPAPYPPEPAVAAAPAPRRPVAAEQPTAPQARIEYASPHPGTARTASARRRTPTWVWATASALLLVTLLAQSAYFLRDTLAGLWPASRPAFEQACDALGCTLSLPRDLAQLRIVGSDLQTEASGRLKLTLTLGNRASHVEAWPMLVLTLTDQRNQPLARRSFAPSEYLADPARIAAGIPPRSEQPLSLPLTVRDLTPMGFNLQLTY